MTLQNELLHSLGQVSGIFAFLGKALLTRELHPSRLREYLETKRGKYRRDPQSEKTIEVEHMGTGRKKQIRIIKQGIAGNLPESKVAPASIERPKQDPMAGLICSVSGWVAEFKERRPPDPRITFQALFKSGSI